MKKIAFLTFVLLASAVLAEPTGPYLSYLGYDVGYSTSAEYSNFFGAYAGRYSSDISRSGFYGAAAGSGVYGVYGCNGIGFWALADSDYMTNVVAIGSSAGRGANWCANCVFIGADVGRDVGYVDWRTDINGQFYADRNSGVFSIRTDPSDAGSGIAFSNGCLTAGGVLVLDANGKWVIDGGCLVDGYKPSDFEVEPSSDGSSCVVLKKDVPGSEAGFLANPFAYNGNATGMGNPVYFIGGVIRASKKVDEIVHQSDLVAGGGGRGSSKSVEIEDEDTGEKYIIKVKSGALKLYKVEE